MIISSFRAPVYSCNCHPLLQGYLFHLVAGGTLFRSNKKSNINRNKNRNMNRNKKNLKKDKSRGRGQQNKGSFQ